MFVSVQIRIRYVDFDKIEYQLSLSCQSLRSSFLVRSIFSVSKASSLSEVLGLAVDPPVREGLRDWLDWFSASDFFLAAHH